MDGRHGLTWVTRSDAVWRARWEAPGGGAPLDRWEVFEALAHDAGAREALTRALLEVPFEAIAWETPPLGSSVSGIGEWAAVPSPRLAEVAPDPSPFTGPFAEATPGAIATFDNLGGDATLVVPRPDGGRYPHLLAFLRTAPAATIDALWAAVGTAVLETDRDPVWVSTAGLGVYWLHVRLDDRPKYYRHAPYRAL